MAKQVKQSLLGSIVLVTGAGRGLGRFYAERLAARGARLVLVARSAAELEEVADVIMCRGGRVTTQVADVTDTIAVQCLVGRIEAETGPIDVLINNAGVRGPIGNAWDCDWEAWWRTIEVNLGGAAAFSSAVIPKMAMRRKGRVVNIVSEAGVYCLPTVSAYSVSKAALIKFSENLASECRKFSLSVFAYHPGVLPLGLAKEAMDSPSLASLAQMELAAWFRAQIESGEASLLPDESAEKLSLLLSGAYDGLSGRYITVHDDLDVLLERVQQEAASKDYRMLRASV